LVNLENLYFTDITSTGQNINRITAAGVTFTNIMLNVAPADLENYVNGTPVPAGIIAGGAPSANLSVLSWTWASQAGGFSGL
jgi:hypothetical protein